MKRVLAKMFGWPLVWTEDYDGALRLRRVYRHPFRTYVVRAICEKAVFLNEDGSTGGRRYVERWMPANQRAESLFPVRKMD